MAVRMRTLAAFAAGAIVAPLLPFAALPAYAEGEATPPAAQSFVDFCVNVPEDFEPFADVNGNRFKDAIECLAFARVTKGLREGVYGPDVDVNRGQMASFIAQVIDTADRLDTGENIQTLPPYDGSPAFSDIDGTTHEANISRLADAGIVRGSNGRYDPNGPVTRDQMATFINAALDYMTGEPGQTSNDYFTDDTGNIHEGNINGITSLGITTGRTADSYEPNTRIDRDNMAAFLARTLGELEERGDIGPAVGNQDIQVMPDSEATFDAVTNPDTNTADDRSYTATGLIAGEEYRVTLVEASTVGQTASGETTFTDSDNDNLAEVGDRTADITQVNGQPAQNNTGDGTSRTPTNSTNGGTAVGTATGNGELTFVVDGDADGESVIPLVYRNGGSGNSPEEGGSSPRLELNDDGTPAEPFDIGGQITYAQAQQTTSVTDGPDLVSAQFVRFTGTGASEVTTVRYTFDEAVTAGGVNEDNFFLYTFDGRQINSDQDDSTLNDPNDARRDTADERSVLVVFPVNSQRFADVTLATVEQGAVQDSAGVLNPIGDAALGSGVTFTAGRTDAPDLISIGNFRPATATSGATLVDFTFDEAAFVVNGSTGRFQLIQPDGDELLGTAVDNGATPAAGDFVGDGTTTITVQVTNEDTNGDGTNDETITAASVVRGVVLQGTVSDAQQTNPNPVDNPAEGNVNPLQVTDANDGGTTTVPDLVSATIDESTGTVTYVFDEDVVVVDATRFRVYDRRGVETAGSSVSGRDNNPNDNTVIVVFPAGRLDAVTGASVNQGAVRQSGSGTTRVNQEDEVGTASQPVPAGETVGPDLTDVTRELQTRSRTDPFTGETTTTVTGVTIRFVFDDEAAIPGNATGDGGFFVVNAAGTRTRLTDCRRANNTTVQGEENVIVCNAPQDRDPVQPGNQGEAEFVAARDAVLGTVQDRAVVDSEGTRNPEGAEVIAGA